MNVNKEQQWYCLGQIQVRCKVGGYINNHYLFYTVIDGEKFYRVNDERVRMLSQRHITASGDDYNAETASYYLNI